MPAPALPRSMPRRRPAQTVVAGLVAVLVVLLVVVVFLTAILGRADASSARSTSATDSESTVVAGVSGVIGGVLGGVRDAVHEPRLTKAWSRKDMLRRVVTLVNEARSEERSCGDEHFRAVGPVHRNRRLDRAASSYARQMARGDFFDHIGLDGLDPGDRIRRAGYRWRTYGENIAAGYSSARDVVDAWIESPGHCANLMGRFRAIGVGYSWDDDSHYGGYWVQEFATR